MQQVIDNRPVIAITMGDAAGCGPEITVKALANKGIYQICKPIVYGDAIRIKSAIDILKFNLAVNVIAKLEEAKGVFGCIDVLDFANIPHDLPFGLVSPIAGHAAYTYIEQATYDALDKKISAVVTAPLNKEALHLGGHNFPGHTEIFAKLSNTDNYAMMLSAKQLKVIHVTTHVSMLDAAKLIKKERVLRIIKLADNTLRMLGIAKPRIAVAGFNAHAGENGLFGDEEILEIIPAVEQACCDGIDVTGPLPPDTVFFRAACRSEFDIVVAMYHDQGHIPVKILGFESGVNITVGLPLIRVSVDHGTAFDIAGTGIADSLSLEISIKLAAQMGCYHLNKVDSAGIKEEGYK